MANPRCYSVVNNGFAVASPSKTALTLVANTTVRGEIYQMVLGSSAAPADAAIQWDLQRFTAAGTTTAVTPSPLDPADPASQCSAGKSASVEPTYTANLILFHIALNQRASYTWNANYGSNLKIPATASNGAGLYPTNASATPNIDCQVFFNE